MAQLYNGVYIWLYRDVDQAMYDWMEDWALTPQWIDDGSVTHAAQQIKRVFATPDRAFSQMRKIMGLANVPTHEATIPLPFYSIHRLDPVHEPDRDLVMLGGTRAYSYRQVKCTVCDNILSLAQFNTGVCPYCASSISETVNSEFTEYDLEDKTEAEALADKWHYEGSEEMPQPYMVTYQFDLWTKTLGEANYQQMQIARQFTKGDIEFDIDYPRPFDTQRTYIDNLEMVNNSDLEPGEDNVNIRFTFSCDVHTWLPPLIQRVGPVKELDIEYHNLDGSVEFYVDEDVFD